MPHENEWQERGACRGIDVALFFPVVEHEACEAKAICSMCPVRMRCLEFALAEGERFGIWGGYTTLERKELLAERRAVELLVAEPTTERAPVPG
jgi:WhiB family redox-sensing transcriptional regulator